MTLIVGSKRFPLNTGFQTQDEDWTWTNTGITWTEGQQVNIAIEVPTEVAETQEQATAPRNLRAQIVDGRVALRWDAPTEDAASVGGYEILRRRSNQGERTFTTLVSDTGNAATTYTDATATEPAVRYTYRVKAIRSGVRSPRSNFAQATVLLPPTLVSNIGQSSANTATITQQYAQGFRLGKHGQGYAISSVLIELAAVPSDLTVSLWIGGVSGGGGGSGDVQRKVFDFANPSSFRVGLNKFTAPAGAFAYPNVNYFIVLTGFGSSLQVRETTSDDQDQGGETGAVISNNARQRGLTATGRWGSYSTRSNVLRLALEGSRRDRGILASGLAQTRTGQEIISLGDKCCFAIAVGAADRYLIRGLALEANDTTVTEGFFGLPFTVGTEFSLAYANARPSLTGPAALTGPAGLNEWVAPQGATVAGSKKYTIGMDIKSIAGDTPDETRGGVTLGRIYFHDPDDDDATPELDTPSAPGVTLSGAGTLVIGVPMMAVAGESLVAMAQNMGQTNDGYHTVNSSTSNVSSQGFTTGSDSIGYRLQGIGVNIEGSGSKFPDGPSSVSVAVHADSSGEPGAKLFDLVSPDEFGAGHSFFEAPPGTFLAPNTSYVMVWSHVSGTVHRLVRTSSDSEDSGALTDFSIADAFYWGADTNNLAVSADGHALEIAVYGEAGSRAFVPGGYQVRRSWFHLPEDVDVGDQFRVAYVTHHGIDATSGDVAHYDALVQYEAAQEYNDRFIRSIASEFKAVVCTETVDARTHTEMTDDLGVPIHWMDNGVDERYLDPNVEGYDDPADAKPTLVARSYVAFYSGEWVNREYGAIVTGNSTKFYKHKVMWTGCDARGVAHPVAHMGTTSLMGMVALGTPGHRNDMNDLDSSKFAPLGPVDATATDFVGDKSVKEHRIYGISPILTVVP